MLAKFKVNVIREWLSNRERVVDPHPPPSYVCVCFPFANDPR